VKNEKIKTRQGAGGFGDRIPVGAKFSSPVQAGYVVHPASYTMRTWSFPGLKRPGRDVDHPPPSSAEVKESVKLFLYSPSGSSWPVLGWTLPLVLHDKFKSVPNIPFYRAFNLKVYRQLSREYFTSDAIYNGSAGMTLHYYMCRSWQDCCRRGENQSWPSVSVESVDSECWCLNNAILRLHNAVNSGRTCIYFGKLFKNDFLRPL